MSNPILFENVHLNVLETEMQIMYFYKDYFFLQTPDDQIALIEKGDFEEEVLASILGDKEQQTEVVDDPRALELLEDVIASIKKAEDNPEHE